MLEPNRENYCSLLTEKIKRHLAIQETQIKNRFTTALEKNLTTLAKFCQQKNTQC
jgi:flagellar biosynthesis chaperone FliJ